MSLIKLNAAVLVKNLPYATQRTRKIFMTVIVETPAQIKQINLVRQTRTISAGKLNFRVRQGRGERVVIHFVCLRKFSLLRFVGFA